MATADGLAFTASGDGDPVLLIHGSHVADSFRPLADEPVLADRYRLIRYHRRGFADSARHTGPFSIAQQARDALRVAQQFECDRFHVVGHSYGAVTAIQLALDAPECVATLVLLEPPLAAPDDVAERSALLAPLVEIYRAGDARGAVEAFMEIIGGPDWRDAVARTVPGGAEQAERDAATFFEVEVPALEAWHFDDAVASRISPPVLFVIGSESGPLFDRPRQLFVTAVPHSEEVVLPGLNHLLQMQDPALVAGPIAEFLRRYPLSKPTGSARRRARP